MQNPSTETRTGFGLSGAPMDPDLPRCVAKSVVRGDESLYWVKVATSGPRRGYPYAFEFNEPGDLTRFVAQFGKDLFEWASVNRDSFEAYLRYLETRNPLHLRHAERS